VLGPLLRYPAAVPCGVGRISLDHGSEQLEVGALSVPRAGAPVLAAGGISSKQDLAGVAETGAEGAVVERALLTGALPLDLLARARTRADTSLRRRLFHGPAQARRPHVRPVLPARRVASAQRAGLGRDFFFPDEDR